MHADHRGMNKFRNRHDDNYQLLLHHLSQIYQKRSRDSSIQRDDYGGNESRSKRLSRTSLPARERDRRAAPRNSNHQTANHHREIHGVRRDDKITVGGLPPDLLESFNILQLSKGITPTTSSPLPFVSIPAEANDRGFSSKEVLHVELPHSQVPPNGQDRSASSSAFVPKKHKGKHNAGETIHSWLKEQDSNAVAHMNCRLNEDESQMNMSGGQSAHSQRALSPNSMPADLREAARILGISRHESSRPGLPETLQYSDSSSGEPGVTPKHPSCLNPGRGSPGVLLGRPNTCSVSELPANSARSVDLLSSSLHFGSQLSPGSVHVISDGIGTEYPRMTRPDQTKSQPLPWAYDSLRSLVGAHNEGLLHKWTAIAGPPCTGQVNCLLYIGNPKLTSSKAKVTAQKRSYAR